MKLLAGNSGTNGISIFLAEQPQGGMASWLPMIGYLLFFGVLMYFMVFLPQKRKDKKARELMESLQNGMKVTTTCGVIGKIINIKDDIITIETSIERTQIDFLRTAIHSVEKME